MHPGQTGLVTVRDRRRRGHPVGGREVVGRGPLIDAAGWVIGADGAGTWLEGIAVQEGVTERMWSCLAAADSRA